MCGKEMTVNITAIPMPYGDFFIVVYEGMSGAKHVVVLDMGTQAAYRETGREVLRQYEAIDLCVLSHIHDDHIGGALKYADDVNGGVQVPEIKQWWFNDRRVSKSSKDDSASEPISVKHANEIASYLSSHFDADSWRNEIKRGDIWNLDGLTIYVLSPDNVKYYDEIPCPDDDKATIPIAVSHNDYNVSIGDFDMDAFEENDNDNNKHSMALLLDFGGKRFLWMADTVPSVVCQSLREMGFSEEVPLECEYMTLAHHGSKGNTCLELLSLVRCDKFIVTGNGMNTYNLPNKETLARVIHQYGEQAQFYSTSLSWQLERVFDVDRRGHIKQKNTFVM